MKHTKEILTEARDKALDNYIKATQDVVKLDKQAKKKDNFTSSSFDKEMEKAMDRHTAAWDKLTDSGVKMSDVRKAMHKAGIPDSYIS